jgi:hypothetical protein
MFLLGTYVEFRNIRELTQPSVAIGLSTNLYTKVTKAIRTSLFQEVGSLLGTLYLLTNNCCPFTLVEVESVLTRD